MRIAVIGATGNVGTSVVRNLAHRREVDSIVGIARRRPATAADKVEWRTADISRDDLAPLLRGADAVVHLAWLIQPARDQSLLQAVNVRGSARVFDAVRRAEVPALVYASSVGAYAPGSKEVPVDESWPTDGVETAYYSRQKAEVERLLDEFEHAHSDCRVVRLRPALIFKRESATEQQRLFLGRAFPRWVLSAPQMLVIPDSPRLRFQAVHADDVAEAYVTAALGDARGAFNIAAPDVIDPRRLAWLLRARLAPAPENVLRRSVDLSFKLRLQPTPADWFDMAVESPLLDISRARDELGFAPRVSGLSALRELIDGIRDHAAGKTPPLAPRPSEATRATAFGVDRAAIG